MENGQHNRTEHAPNGSSDAASGLQTSASQSGAAQSSLSAAMINNHGDFRIPYPVTAKELGEFSNDRSRTALANLLEIGCKELGQAGAASLNGLGIDVVRLVAEIRAAGESSDDHDHTEKEDVAAAKNADDAAAILTTALLRSSPEAGIHPREVEFRREVFGSNALTEKDIESFLKLCWDAVQDFVLVMLIVLGVIIMTIEITAHEGPCKTCWIEGAAILCSVCVVVLVTAGIDYAKQFAFIRLSKSLHESNTKSVIRAGKLISVTDDEIVVGDILSVNSHNLASIPADCVLLGPASNLKMNESSLTGESHLISKRPGDVVLSGTNAVEGSGKMVVIAVGVNSVSGKIKARVYETEDHDDELGGDGENSPLFMKLDEIAKRIGIGGTIAASIAFVGSCILGLLFDDDDAGEIVQYMITAITVLAVAVPEGLPLAVTLSLAFSSNKMMAEQNLVKHLDACETMGCATTICTDKTGTLTANKMTARALFAGKVNYTVEDPKITLGTYAKSYQGGLNLELLNLLCRAISIDTMNESVLSFDSSGRQVGAAGNPTELALLHLVHDLGQSVDSIRDTTKGRSDKGDLGLFLSEGRQYGFSSARKMMSWAVPHEDGGYRLYSKGASEVIMSRCAKYSGSQAEDHDFSPSDKTEFEQVALLYARRGMRCLALAYRDLPAGFDLDKTSDTVKNSDGSSAFESETEMTLIAFVGIEDPLRPEVPGAIEKCYTAGIDVRLVTGDNANTAVSIAYQAGILRDFHFIQDSTERVVDNLKENVMMEGRVFRSEVYREGEDGTKQFDQEAFDKIWPHLRVLARSSPDDKLTLAHGLNQSNLFADKEECKRLKDSYGIKIFPDRQVIAMTGDGTNDAPALKRADIGFAMGIAGTQIAKDAADIILIDDNFASIVTAAKWGRNVYASIQKFLQFQLTVNIAAVVTALVGAFDHQISPLAAIQLLWVNLLMDSLASLALASEPPVEELLKKPPVNRTDSMITKHMMANMIGQAAYQIVVVMTLYFKGPDFFGFEYGHILYDEGENSEHYTLIFNAFVWMQLFNEINCRKLKGESNVFKGILDNSLFYGILITTAVLQVLIVEFGSIAFSVSNGGLDLEYWGWSMLFGAGSLPVQQIINALYRMGQSSKELSAAEKAVIGIEAV